MMKVPERARVTDHPTHKQLGTDATFGNNGLFQLDSPEHSWQLVVIASDGTYADGEARAWEHVSVHAIRHGAGRHEQQRTPTWREMSFIKELFWDDEDVVMQLHPKRSEYVNRHAHTLHLWRHATIPTPPKNLV